MQVIVVWNYFPSIYGTTQKLSIIWRLNILQIRTLPSGDRGVELSRRPVWRAGVARHSGARGSGAAGEELPQQPLPSAGWYRWPFAHLPTLKLLLCLPWKKHGFMI